MTLGTALKWAVTLVEVAHVLPLSVAALRMRPGIARWPRPLALALIVVVNLVNVLSLVLLIDALLHGRTNLGHAHLDGRTLILAAIEIWLTNVLVFALWYCASATEEGNRRCSDQRVPDVLVPQWIAAACRATSDGHVGSRGTNGANNANVASIRTEERSVTVRCPRQEGEEEMQPDNPQQASLA